MDRFKKTLGKINRKPVSKERFESLTGTSFEKSKKEESLENSYQILKKQLEEARDEEEKKKIHQRANLLGIQLD